MLPGKRRTGRVERAERRGDMAAADSVRVNVFVELEPEATAEEEEDAPTPFIVSNERYGLYLVCVGTRPGTPLRNGASS